MKFSNKMATMAALFAIVMGAAIYFILACDITKVTKNRIEEEQKSNIEFFISSIKGAKNSEIRLNKKKELVVGNTDLSKTHYFVDEYRRITGNHATIFKGDRVISTTVLTEKGKRDNGGSLAKGPVYDRIFKGENIDEYMNILGTEYYASYRPLKNKDGKVFGILFVGTEVADIDAKSGTMKCRLMTVVGGSTLVFALLLALVMKRKLRQFDR